MTHITTSKMFAKCTFGLKHAHKSGYSRIMSSIAGNGASYHICQQAQRAHTNVIHGYNPLISATASVKYGYSPVISPSVVNQSLYHRLAALLPSRQCEKKHDKHRYNPLLPPTNLHHTSSWQYNHKHAQQGNNPILSPNPLLSPTSHYPLLSPTSHNPPLPPTPRPYHTTPARPYNPRRPPLVFTDIADDDDARTLVLQLRPEGRSLVLAELKKVVEEEKHADKTRPEHVDTKQLQNLFYFNALPFVGFGFLDNFIMIVAGEYIDTTLGATLAISTMAAAAMGNLVSDVAGIGLSGQGQFHSLTFISLLRLR